MERLTNKVGTHVIYNGVHRHYEGGDIPAEMSHEAIRDVLRRLAAYEDTGLEPEEIAAGVPTELGKNIAEVIPTLVQAIVENMPKIVDIILDTIEKRNEIQIPIDVLYEAEPED